MGQKKNVYQHLAWDDVQGLEEMTAPWKQQRLWNEMGSER